jgi:hypothetical protein
MNFFYLSEMAISSKHGGGLTMQRIFDKKIDEFSLFFCLTEFSKICPTIDKLQSKTELFLEIEDYLPKKFRFNSYIRKSRILIQLNGFLIAYKISRRIKGTTGNLLLCPQAEISLQVTKYLTKLTKLNVFIWQMDDHLLSYDGQKFHYKSSYQRKLMNNTLNAAKEVWVISPRMQEFYEGEFGVKSKVLFGPALKSNNINEKSQEHKTKRFIYFGAIGSWQLDAIQLFTKIIKELDAYLDVYSHNELPEELITEECIRHKGAISPEEVIALSGTYDGVLLPISFKQNMRNMSELNIATKMSECLASGTLTIAVGPSYAAMIDYLKENKCALIIEDPEISNLNEIKALLNDQGYIDQTIRTALTHAENNLMQANTEKKINSFFYDEKK